jgi:Phage tail protein
MRIAFNGLELGDDSLYNVTSIDGLDSLPDLTIGMAPKPRRHGSWLGGKLAQKRVITLSFDILGDPNDDWRTTKPKNALVNAFQLMDVELPLIFEMDYGETPVLVHASVTSLDLPIAANYSRQRSGTVEFTCTDPMKYATESKTGKASPPTTPDAAAYGQPYGFAYSVTTGLSGTFNASNTGNSPAPVIYKIVGPITRPVITLDDAAGTRSTRFEVTLKASDRLEVDTAMNRVTVNGADKFGSTSGALIADLTMKPGDTTVAFTGENTGGAVPPSLTATWRDATR